MYVIHKVKNVDPSHTKLIRHEISYRFVFTCTCLADKNGGGYLGLIFGHIAVEYVNRSCYQGVNLVINDYCDWCDSKPICPSLNVKHLKPFWFL